MNESNHGSEEKLDFKQIAPILLIVLIDLLGLTIIIPLLPIYAATFGANPFIIGVLGAAYPLMQFVGAPILGQLSDRYGRRPVLIVSQIGTFIGFILLGVANSLAMLFLSRVIDGISGANIATAQAAISDNTTEKTRTQGLGLIGAAFGVGFVIGPLLAFAILTLSDNNYRLVAFTAAAFSAISILLSWLWLQESLPAEKRGQGGKTGGGIAGMLQALRLPVVGLLMFMMFAQQFAFHGFEQFIPLFTLNRLGLNGSENAALFGFVGILLVIVQGRMVGIWSRRFGDRRLALVGLVALGVGMILSALTPDQPVPWYDKEGVIASLQMENAGSSEAAATFSTDNVALPEDDHNGWLGLVWMLLALVPVSVGGGILMPAINSLITQTAAATEIGSMLGVSAAFASLANALSPLAMGAIYQILGSSAPFILGGAILLLLFAFAGRRLPGAAS